MVEVGTSKISRHSGACYSRITVLSGWQWAEVTNLPAFPDASKDASCTHGLAAWRASLEMLLLPRDCLREVVIGGLWSQSHLGTWCPWLTGDPHETLVGCLWHNHDHSEVLFAWTCDRIYVYSIRDVMLIEEHGSTGKVSLLAVSSLPLHSPLRII